MQRNNLRAWFQDSVALTLFFIAVSAIAATICLNTAGCAVQPIENPAIVHTTFIP